MENVKACTICAVYLRILLLGSRIVHVHACLYCSCQLTSILSSLPPPSRVPPSLPGTWYPPSILGTNAPSCPPPLSRPPAMNQSIHQCIVCAMMTRRSFEQQPVYGGTGGVGGGGGGVHGSTSHGPLAAPIPPLSSSIDNNRNSSASAHVSNFSSPSQSSPYSVPAPHGIPPGALTGAHYGNNNTRVSGEAVYYNDPSVASTYGGLPAGATAAAPYGRPAGGMAPGFAGERGGGKVTGEGRFLCFLCVGFFRFPAQ